MSLFLHLAWRNLFRNRQQSLTFFFSTFLACLLGIFILSLQKGTSETMLKQTIGRYFGHFLIKKKNDSSEKDLFFNWEKNIKKSLAVLPELIAQVPRVEQLTLLSIGEKSASVLLIGIDFRAEKFIFDPQQRIVQGTYFASEYEKSILLAEELAVLFNVKEGDSLLISFPNENKNGIKLNVRGTIRSKDTFPSVNLVIVPLGMLQKEYNYPGKINSLHLLCKSQAECEAALPILEKIINKYNLEAFSWKKQNADLLNLFSIFGAVGWLVWVICYLVVGISLYGMMMMSYLERKTEFAVSKAIGFRPILLLLVFLTEILLKSIFGVLMALLLSYPALLYLQRHPPLLGGTLSDSLRDLNLLPLLSFDVSFFTFSLPALLVLIFNLLIGLSCGVGIFSLSVPKLLRQCY